MGVCCAPILKQELIQTQKKTMIESRTNEVQEQRGEIHTLLPTVPCNVVYNEDCMKGLKRFPDKYFDLAVVVSKYFRIFVAN